MGRVSPQAPIKSRLGRPSGAPGKPTSQRNDTQSIVAGVRPSKCPYILTVIAIALATHRNDETVPVEDSLVIIGAILGGFNRSSQHG